MKPLLTLLMVMTAGGALAQTLPSADVDTVRSGIGEESLAPLVVKKTVSSTSSTVTVTTSGSVPAAIVSGTVANDPFTVKGVVVTLSDTTGFDRDAALEQAARQAMPGVLTGMGMATTDAAKAVKSVGSAMNFVKSFKVVKESLIPVYTLTSDLTFNGPMLQKNFGMKIPAKPLEAVTGAAPATEAVNNDVVPAGNVVIKQWVVKIDERDPALVDRVRTNLNSQAATKATYRLLTSNGAELLVETPLDADAVSRVAGHPVSVVEVTVALPNGVIQTGGGNPQAWQGQEQPAAPNAPASPNAPGAPADPNGGAQ